MSRKDDTRAQRDEFVASQSAELALLQHAQQLDLDRQTKIANFIQEQRAFRRLFEETNPGTDGAGKRPLLVAEQFCLNQRLRDGTAGDGNKGSVGALAQIVNCMGD